MVKKLALLGMAAILLLSGAALIAVPIVTQLPEAMGNVNIPYLGIGILVAALGAMLIARVELMSTISCRGKPSIRPGDGVYDGTNIHITVDWLSQMTACNT